MIPSWMSMTYLAGLGACLGSFVGVVVDRLPAQESIVRPRSRCGVCRTPIAWYDNIPILSYCLLLGRCRACRSHIPIRALLVEVLLAAIFVALWIRFDWSWELLVWLPLATALLAITFLDIDHWWIPDVITYPLMLYVGLAAMLPGRLSLAHALLGLIPAALAWLVAWGFARITKREGLGLGDVKLLAVLGLTLGLSDGLSVLILAAFQGALLGSLVVLLGGHATGQAEPTNQAPAVEDPAAKPAEPTPAPEQDAWVPPPRAIPFGPFLVLAAFEVVLLPQVFAGLTARITGLFLEGLG